MDGLPNKEPIRRLALADIALHVVLGALVVRGLRLRVHAGPAHFSL